MAISEAFDMEIEVVSSKPKVHVRTFALNLFPDALIAKDTQVDEGNVVMNHHCSPDEDSEEDS